eukprot:TRINITY_DN3536_c0_g1_i3.p1 TRINITY_DN3536_c0_g1~~TRINITY_DN3536_c0_g1_i3.p1  ORF type:complete len:130 (-),score=20.18 TRINITY_DN3536_c0_g1_i3:59-403(-)
MCIRDRDNMGVTKTSTNFAGIDEEIENLPSSANAVEDLKNEGLSEFGESESKKDEVEEVDIFREKIVLRQTEVLKQPARVDLDAVEEPIDLTNNEHKIVLYKEKSSNIPPIIPL